MINDFDEGVLIPEPFFWGNVIFKICSFCIESHVRSREEFLWVAPPDCNAAKLRNECFFYYSCWLCFTKQELAIYQGKPNNGKYSVRKIVTFEIEGQILKMTLPQKNGHRLKTPSSELTILVSSCSEKNSTRNNVHNFFYSVPRFSEIIDWTCCILSGPPCIVSMFYFLEKAHV